MAVTLVEAKEEIKRFQDEYQGLRGLRIEARQSQTDVYGPKGSIELQGVIKGSMHISKGIAFVMVDHAQSLPDLRDTLRHEALGHYALVTFTDSDKRQLLAAISASRASASMQPMWAYVDDKYSGKSESMKAEEVYCTMAETVGKDGKKPKGADIAAVWSQVVTNKVRPLENRDLAVIVDWVADGIRRGVRSQQIFPKDDQSQFRTGDVAIKRADAFLNMPKVQAISQYPELKPVFDQATKAENLAAAAMLGNPKGVARVMEVYRSKVAEHLRSGAIVQEAPRQLQPQERQR